MATPRGNTGSKNASLAGAATRRIRDKILDLTLRPGMHLDETVLREQLGISRTPAREALNRLVTEGLVETRANRGFSVRPLDLGDIAQFFDAYMVAERSAAYFCRFSNRNLVSDLEAIQARHETAIRAHRFLEVSQHNAALHIRIMRASENVYLLDFSGRLHNLGRRLAYFVYHNEAEDAELLSGQQEHIVAEHRRIIDAIRRRDREALVQDMTSHAERFQTRISRFVSAQGRVRFDVPPSMIPADMAREADRRNHRIDNRPRGTTRAG